MRKVKLKPQSKNDKGFYSLFLTPELKFQFNDKRKYSDFLTKINSFFNDITEDLNLVFIQVFTIFRENYFYFSRRYEIKQIQNELDIIQSLLDRVVFNSEFQTKNIFVFIDLEKVFGFLTSVISQLTTFFQTRSLTQSKNKALTILRNTHYISKQFYDFQIENEKNAVYQVPKLMLA